MTGTIVVGLVTWLGLVVATDPAVSAVQCVVSDDPTYAYTRENPVLIGGGARTVAARERRYMDTLRGPGGESLDYQRRGSGSGPDETILDIYEVSYDGLDEPFILYLDAYRWAEPEVPRGLSCGGPFNLPVPGPDPFGMAEEPPASARRPAAPGGAPRLPPDPGALTAIDSALNGLAIEYAVNGRAIEPIPLDPERPEIGVALAPFHRKVLRARAQVEAGDAPELPLELGPGVVPTGGNTIVVYPLACPAGRVLPREIEYIGMTRPGQTGPVRAMWEGRGADEIAAYLPGFDVPEGAIAVAMFSSSFNRNDAVIVRYDGDPCGLDDARRLPTGAEVRLPIDVQAPRPVQQVHAPDAVDVTTVRVRGVIDVDGVPHAITVLQGIAPLHDDAIRLAGEWRWRPYAVNQTAVPLAIGYIIRFGS